MIALVSEKISIDELLASVEDTSTGAVVLFLGRVRDHAEGREVRKMDYEAYPDMAEKKMRELAKEVQGKWPISKIAIVHRTGNLQLGEVSVAIAVSSAHRQEAFEAGKYAIDTLKNTVPIWKKEYFGNGEGWVEGVTPQFRKS